MPATEKNFFVDVKPELLEWAIRTSGAEKTKILANCSITETKFKAWLDTTEKPTYGQIENLAKTVKRPIAAFFLETPPLDKPKPKDYRKLPNKENQFDTKTLLAIRKARQLQAVSKNLLENINSASAPEILQAHLSDNPEIIAKKVREQLSLDIEKIKKMTTPNQVFNYLRDVLEDKQVFVFQYSMPINDARGFCLTDDYPIVLVVNSKDKIQARVFTLAHELGHAILRETEIDIPSLKRDDTQGKIETWCNDFASSLILPQDSLQKELDKVIARNPNKLTQIQILAKTFNLSKGMIAYRLNKNGHLNQTDYSIFINKFEKQEIPSTTKSKSRGKSGISIDKRCFSEKGQKFVSLVVNNAERGNITRFEALNYLSVKSKNIDKIIRRLNK